MKKNYMLSLITLVICVLSFNNAIGQDTEKPSVPTGLVISSKTDTTVTLSWNPSTDNVGIAFYQVYKNGNWQAGTVDTFFVVNDIETTLSYTFAVDAYDAAGNGSVPCEAILLGVADTEAPTVPQNLVASEITQTSFKLSWDASTDNNGIPNYEIFINDVWVGGVAGLTKTFEGLTCGTTYSISLDAFDGASPANISAKSSPIEVTTADCSAENPNLISNPGFEEGLVGWGPWENMNIDTVTQRSGKACMIAGNGVAGANGGGNTGISGLVVGKKYVLTTWAKFVNDSSDVIPNQVAYMAVQFVDAAWAEVSGTLTSDITGYTDWAQSKIEFTVPVGCEIVSPYIWLAGSTKNVFMLNDDWELVEVDAEAPTVPQNIVASEITQNSVKLSWDASTDNSGKEPIYQYYINDVKGDTVSGLTKTIEGLSCETEYTFTIVAIDGANPANISAKSEPVAVITPECNLLSNPGFEEGFAGWGVWEKMFLDSISPRTGKYCMMTGPVQGGGATGYAPEQGKKYVFSAWTKFIGTGNLTKPSNSHIGIAFLDSLGQQTDVTVSGIKITTDWAQTTLEFVVPAGCLNIVPYVWETGAVADVSMLFDDCKLVEFVGDTIKPSTPTGLVVSDITSTSFQLSWNNSTDNSGVSGYEFTLNDAWFGFSPDNVQSFTRLEPNTTYKISVYAVDLDGNFSVNSDTMTVLTLEEIIDGIADTRLNDNFIFPNPASTSFSISNLKAHSNLVVYSTEGKIITNVKSVEDKMSFDVSGWNKGVYFISIQNSENKIVKKIVVQ